MKKSLIVLALALSVMATSAFADLRSPQVTIGASPASEATLQQILDTIYAPGSVNAATQQQAAQTWYLPGPSGQVTAPLLKATYSADSDAVGIYTGGTLVNIFTGAATAGTVATIQFNSNGTITIGGGAGVNTGTFSGISQNNFGFYLNNGSTNFFTQDSLNGGTARALSYVDTLTDRWAVAFEDGTDFDFNDRVISVESIVATPEPASLMLLGVGLLGFGKKLYKK